MDPELLAMDLQEASKILDLWRMEGINESESMFVNDNYTNADKAKRWS